jgi:hypothetical protein
MDVLKSKILGIKSICRKEEYFFHVGDFSEQIGASLLIIHYCLKFNKKVNRGSV